MEALIAIHAKESIEIRRVAELEALQAHNERAKIERKLIELQRRLAELERQELLKIIPTQVEVSVDDNCTNSFLVEDVCLEKPAGDSLVDIEHGAR